MSTKRRFYWIFSAALGSLLGCNYLLSMKVSLFTETLHVTDIPKIPLTQSIQCISYLEGPCCMEWEFDMDDFWHDHPGWEWSFMNKSHQCFSLIQDPRKVEYIQKLHSVQWDGNCSLVRGAFQISSGFTASIGTQLKSFYAAFKDGVPYSPSKHWEGAKWLYAWHGNYTVCDTADLKCYFLPITKCQSRIGQNDAGKHIPSFDKEMLKWYLTRPKQWLRRQIYEYIFSNFNSTTLPYPCTLFHVRRGDLVHEKGTRSYVRLQEYFRASNLTEGENIFLMTDSATAIEEAEFLHPNYNWLYVKRKRFNGYEGGWENHLPSQDPVAEIVAILSELMLSEQCYQIVHTSSSFSSEIYSYMTRHGKEIKRIHVSYQAINGSLPTAPAEKKMLANSFMHSLITDIQSAKQRMNLTKVHDGND